MCTHFGHGILDVDKSSLFFPVEAARHILLYIWFGTSLELGGLAIPQTWVFVYTNIMHDTGGHRTKFQIGYIDLIQNH